MTFLGSLVPLTLIHEAAHLLAAVSLGWKLGTLKLGPILIVEGHIRFAGPWLDGSLALQPRITTLNQFKRDVRIVAAAGPTANILTGLLTIGSSSFFIEIFGVVQLAFGIRNLMPSNDKNVPFGNDGNIVFRITKDQALLQRLYVDLMRDPEQS